jgi:hypothetical protein
MKDSKKYKIRVFENGKVSYDIDIESNDIKWSMEQYQRNREPLTWKIIE